MQILITILNRLIKNTNKNLLFTRNVTNVNNYKMNYFWICSGICSGDRNERNIKNVIFPLIKPLAMSYLEVFKMLVTGREFFGLRDFYRLHNYDIDKK